MNQENSWKTLVIIKEFGAVLGKILTNKIMSSEAVSEVQKCCKIRLRLGSFLSIRWGSLQCPLDYHYCNYFWSW